MEILSLLKKDKTLEVRLQGSIFLKINNLQLTNS
jgi:hypothetical protein